LVTFLSVPSSSSYPSSWCLYHSPLQRADGTITHNYALLQEVINLIPSVDELVSRAQDKELKESLNAIDLLIYPLLLWLVRSNRSYLRLLSENEIPEVGERSERERER
jgi:hypothetical protein